MVLQEKSWGGEEVTAHIYANGLLWSVVLYVHVQLTRSRSGLLSGSRARFDRVCIGFRVVSSSRLSGLGLERVAGCAEMELDAPQAVLKSRWTRQSWLN